MIHEIFPVGPLQCNCSVIGDEPTKEAMVIDPGDDIEDVQATWIGMSPPEKVVRDASLSNGDQVRAGGLVADVLHTPGHTEGSICLYFAPEKKLIAGDTLFAGSIGRTDLPGGSYEKIMQSLHGPVLALPDETIVVPGHGPLTTIGDERETNPFLAR